MRISPGGFGLRGFAVMCRAGIVAGVPHGAAAAASTVMFAPLAGVSDPVLTPLQRLGAIEDLGLGLRWDAPQLRHEIERRAGALARLGARPGAAVAIVHGGTARFFADLLATWRFGATAACLDPALTAFERGVILGFLKPAVILLDDSPVETCGSIPQIALARSEQPAHPVPHQPANPDDPALVLFTSGTTGAPKGVVLSYRALAARMALNVAAIGEAKLARVLVTLPTHFGHGLIGNALTPLLAGGDIVLPPRGPALAQELSRLIDAHRITFLSSVPALWRLALKFGHPPSCGSFTRVHVGSAPLAAALWSEIVRWSRAEVVNCYGMTETANWIAGACSSDGIADGLVGVPWGGSAAVIDEAGTRRASGEGEIVVQSPCLMSGYLARPDLTAAAVRDGWFHTGDRGTIDRDGRIRLTGRIKDEINRAGLKVQPAELDLLLEGHPSVAEACAFAVSDPVSGETVGVAVRLHPGAADDAESLRAWCRTRLRREAVPERWFIVEEIPRTMRGKVNRDAVRRRLIGDRASDDAVDHG
jgi:acyl-CoA synthetase (AMP-forming)/AMP-acid ligase II